MLKPIDKKLKLVRIRCSVNLLLKHLGRVLAATGIVAVLSVLTERLLALGIINRWTIWSLCVTVLAVVVLLWLLKQPSRLQVSLLVDQRLGLRERFSTTLALAGSKDPFADAARNEAYQVAGRVSLRGHFPVRPSRCWLYAAGTWVLAAALFLWMPQKDLRGSIGKRQQKEKAAKQLQRAEVAVKQASDPVRLAVKRLDDPNLNEALSRLDQMTGSANPEDIKRQAIRKLGDLSEKLKNMENSVHLDSVNMMQQMLKQLRGSSDPLSQQLRLALAKGDFADASDILRQLQKQLAEGELSDQQRQELAKRLQDMAKRLAELAAKNQELEKELENLGLDKSLASEKDQQKLRQALQKQGLNPDKVEELLRKAAASRMACSRCSGLGKALASCGAGSGGLSGDDLAEVLEQLDELDALKQQLLLTAASIEEIKRAMACLGQGMCEGIGLQGPFMEGLSDRSGAGTGGPGVGYGPRNTAEDGDASTVKTRVKNKPGEGPVIASYYFKDTQVKGEARREFSDVVQAARDSAAEAISENQIPRKYEGAVKDYFGRLEETGGE
jgi:hypothetical protein